MAPWDYALRMVKLAALSIMRVVTMVGAFGDCLHLGLEAAHSLGSCDSLIFSCTCMFISHSTYMYSL